MLNFASSKLRLFISKKYNSRLDALSIFEKMLYFFFNLKLFHNTYIVKFEIIMIITICWIIHAIDTSIDFSFFKL